MAEKKLSKIKITQVRSVINRPEDQKRTITALGLRRIRHSVVQDATPQILGMVNKVKHLVQTEEVK
jgi:large subunit ribosomal protein L30